MLRLCYNAECPFADEDLEVVEQLPDLRNLESLCKIHLSMTLHAIKLGIPSLVTYSINRFSTAADIVWKCEGCKDNWHCHSRKLHDKEPLKCPYCRTDRPEFFGFKCIANKDVNWSCSSYNAIWRAHTKNPQPAHKLEACVCCPPSP